MKKIITGLIKIDEALGGGLGAGKVYIVAGRPEVGKGAFRRVLHIFFLCLAIILYSIMLQRIADSR